MSIKSLTESNPYWFDMSGDPKKVSDALKKFLAGVPRS